MTGRRLFLAYCAFAPYIHGLAAVFAWSLLGSHGNPFHLAYLCMILTTPLTIWMVVEAVRSAGGKTSTCLLLSEMALYPHAIANAYAYVSFVTEEYGGVAAPSPEGTPLFALCSVLLIMASGVALLLTWDGMRRIEQRTP